MSGIAFQTISQTLIAYQKLSIRLFNSNQIIKYKCIKK